MPAPEVVPADCANAEDAKLNAAPRMTIDAMNFFMFNFFQPLSVSARSNDAGHKKFTIS